MFIWNKINFQYWAPKYGRKILFSKLLVVEEAELRKNVISTIREIRAVVEGDINGGNGYFPQLCKIQQALWNYKFSNKRHKVSDL